MRRAGLLEARPSGGSENGEEPAPVEVAPLAPNETLSLEAVDEAGHAALAEEERGGELGHPEPAVRRLGEREEDLVRREREPVLGLELRVERPDDPCVSSEEPTPGVKLERGEVSLDRSLYKQVIFLLLQLTLPWRTAAKGDTMNLEGIHHITAITGDAPRNVDFYTRVLGLRLVKKTVNQDDPTVYHLFYADEQGSPGADLTFFEYPGARPGRAGAGMVHRIVSRVASEEAIEFWAARLEREDVELERTQTWLRFADPEGMAHELDVAETTDESLVAVHPEIPPELALQGFDGVRAYAAAPERSRSLLEGTLGFAPAAETSWEVRGAARGSFYAYDPPPPERGVPGAGTVHHVAWASLTEEHEAWRELVVRAGLQPTPVIDRFWFKSVYFREPSGVLFEIATLGPGFSIDEDPGELGEMLILPPAFEHLRDKVEQVLTPLPNPRADWSVR